MAYGKKVLDHYENPRNVGVLDKDANNVGTGMVGAPACGDVMRLQIQLMMMVLLKRLSLKLMAVVRQLLHLPF